MLEPHLFCKPIAKRPEDREALLKLALSWNPKVMFGSDSAPHTQNAKESAHCSAWVFTAPIALQLLAELFEKNNSLENLQKFVSDNAIKIYNLKLEEKIITLEKSDFTVPLIYKNNSEDVVPMYAGETLKWSIKS